MHLFTVDSVGYISGELIRTPLYPLFLQFCRAVFGGYGFSAAVIIQTLCALLSVLFFLKCLRETLAPKLWSEIALFAVLAGPILLFWRVIITDTLAYAFYLFTLACALRFISDGKSAGWLIAAACLNILVRPQMAFVLPVLAVAFFLKRKYLLLVALCGAMTAAGLADKLYHKIHNGVFMNSGIGSVHLARELLYFSTPQDEVLFSGGPHEQLMKEIFARVEREKLAERFRGENSAADYFTENSNQLAWNTLCDLFMRQNPAAPQQDMVLFCKYVCRVLLPKHGGALPGLWLGKIMERFSLPSIAFVLLLAAFPLFMAGERAVPQLVSFFACLGLSNYLLIALSSCFSHRMDFYSQIAIALSIAIAALGWRKAGLSPYNPFRTAPK